MTTYILLLLVDSRLSQEQTISIVDTIHEYMKSAKRFHN